MKRLLPASLLLFWLPFLLGTLVVVVQGTPPRLPRLPRLPGPGTSTLETPRTSENPEEVLPPPPPSWKASGKRTRSQLGTARLLPSNKRMLLSSVPSDTSETSATAISSETEKEPPVWESLSLELLEQIASRIAEESPKDFVHFAQASRAFRQAAVSAPVQTWLLLHRFGTFAVKLALESDLSDATIRFLWQHPRILEYRTSHDNIQMEAIHTAIRKQRSLDLLQFLLRHVPSGNLRNPIVRASLMHCAVSYGNLRLVRWLIREHSIKPVESLVSAAAFTSNLPMIRFLVREYHLHPDDNNGEPLMYASMNKRLDIVRFLVEHGADPLRSDSALRHSIRSGSKALTNYFLDEIGMPLEFLKTALIDAVSHGNLPVVKRILEKESIPDGVHYEQELLLRTAAGSGQFPVARYLLDLGADMHHNQEEPLRNAIAGGHLPLVWLLVFHGAHVRPHAHSLLFLAVRSPQAHCTARQIIHWGRLDLRLLPYNYLLDAVERKNEKLIAVLLEYGADPARNAWEALTAAIHLDNISIVQLLLCNVQKISGLGMDARTMAMAARNIVLVRLLFSKGLGDNPAPVRVLFSMAAFWGQFQTVQWILSEYPDIVKPADVLVLATQQFGNSVMVQYLLSRITDDQMPDELQRELLPKAVESHDLEQVRVLLRRPSIRSWIHANKELPLYLACSRADGALMVQLLLRHGADPNGNKEMLAVAISSGSLEVVRPILKLWKGREYSALLMAVTKGHEELVDLLLQHGFRASREVEATALLTSAMQKDQPRLLSLLLVNGGESIRALSDHYYLYAVMTSAHRCVRILLEFDNGESKEPQQRALALAAVLGELRMIRFFLQQEGVDPLWKQGIAFRNAVREERVDVLEVLVETMGGPRSLRDRLPREVQEEWLAYARRFPNKAVLNVLLSWFLPAST